MLKTSSFFSEVSREHPMRKHFFQEESSKIGGNRQLTCQIGPGNRNCETEGLGVFSKSLWNCTYFTTATSSYLCFNPGMNTCRHFFSVSDSEVPRYRRHFISVCFHFPLLFQKKNAKKAINDTSKIVIYLCDSGFWHHRPHQRVVFRDGRVTTHYKSA